MIVLTPSLFEDRSVGFTDLIKTLSLSFKDIAKVGQSVLFVVNKCKIKKVENESEQEAYDFAVESFLTKVANAKKSVESAAGLSMKDIANFILHPTGMQVGKDRQELLTFYRKQLELLDLITKDNIVIADVFDQGGTKVKINSFFYEKSKNITSELLDFSQHDDRMVKFTNAIYDITAKAIPELKDFLELPEKVAYLRAEQKINLNNLAFNNKRLKAIEEGKDSGEHEKNVAYFTNKIAEDECQIQNNQLRASQLIAKMQELNKQLADCDSSAPVILWSQTEKRTAWRRLPNWEWLKKIVWPAVAFNYEGPPIAHIYTSDKPSAEERQVHEKAAALLLQGKEAEAEELRKSLGGTLANYFKDVEFDPEQAYYRSNYINSKGPFEAMNVVVEVHVEKRNMPDSIREIPMIKADLAAKENELHSIYEKIKELNLSKDASNSAIKNFTVITTRNLVSDNEKLQKAITENEDEVNNLEKELQRAREITNTKANTYAVIHSICYDLGYQSSLLDTFISLHNRFHQKNSAEDFSPPAYDKREFECPIGKTIMERPIITDCGHTFDLENLRKNMKIKSSCPICNASINKPADKLVVNFALRDAIEAWQERQQKKRNSSIPQSNSPFFDRMGSVKKGQDGNNNCANVSQNLSSEHKASSIIDDNSPKINSANLINTRIT